MNGAFNNQILAEKLSKLNNSQQSIETLSHWCIFHRKKARQVVETWDKKFRELPKEQRVPFLYLANDILQNSRRRGGEFVSEFWRILPGALKDVIEKGDDHGRNIALRLVDIWEERKVFGSRGQSLREELLGKDPPPDLPDNVKSSHKIKIKIPAGGIQEKLTSAYQSVHDVVTDEDATLGRCNAAAIRIEGLEKEIDSLQNTGELQDATLADELQEQQNILVQCVEQLEMCEMARAALVTHLKEALREQESKLELIRTQLQMAQAQSQRAANMRQRLLNSSPNLGEIIQHGPRENGYDIFRDAAANHLLQNQSSGEKSAMPTASSMPTVSLTDSMAPLTENSRKPKGAASIAAEVAAKLAASTSSAQMLTSVLSSLAAEEASSLRTAAAPVEVSASTFSQEKRQRLDGQPDNMHNAEGGAQYVHQLPPPQSNSMQHQAGSLQHHTSSVQHQMPPPPPLPPQPQYMSNAVSMVSVPTYGYGVLPPPPPLQSHQVVGVPRAVMPHQNSSGTPYRQLQPPGIGYYTPPPLPARPIPRQ